MKPGNVINTNRPEQGLGVFVRLAAGLVSVGRRMFVSAQGSFGLACHGGLDRQEDQVHPGEEHA